MIKNLFKKYLTAKSYFSKGKYFLAMTLSSVLMSLVLPLVSRSQSCGLDIYVANDQSGSIDSRENFQGRDFITRLAEVGTLGNASTQNRVAIANWSYYNTFYQYAFPMAGSGYTTNMEDLLSYRSSVRNLSGGTDPYQALQKAYQNITLTPVSGRNVRKVILLMTDAYSYQVQTGIEQLATQIKNAGIYIAVMAIDEARNVTTLSGTKVASPNLYFNALDYATLQNTALQRIGELMNYSCNLPGPSWDLSVGITGVNCATGAVNYTVNNSGVPFSGTLSTSFYNGDPALPSTKLLAVNTRSGTTTIGANTSSAFSFTSSQVVGQAKIYAVVNINSTVNQPPLNHNISSVLLVSGEGNSANNFSAVFNATGCPVATPVLEVKKKVASVNCDVITYDVQVCNTGNATANNVVVTDYPQNSNLSFMGTSGYQGVGNRYRTDIAEDGYWAAINPPNTSVVHYANTTTVAARSYSGTASPNNAIYFYYPTYSFNGGVPKNTPISSAKLIVTVQGDATGINHNTTNLYDVFGHRYSTSPLSQVPTVQDYYINSPGAVTVSHPNIADGSLGNTANIVRTLEIDVTSIVQALVNQSDWTISKYFSFLIKNSWDAQNSYGNPIYYFSEHANAAYRPQLIIETNNPVLNLAPGECSNISFLYKATSSITAPNNNNSAGVTTTTVNTKFLPNTNFSVGTNTGLNGYNGAVNTGDEVTVSLPCTSPTFSQLTNSISVNSLTTCSEGGFTRARVTISNPNSMVIRNSLLQLNLTGTNVKFAGEPYNISNGLKLATADILNAAYPNVNYALRNKSGIVTLPVYEIPASGSVFFDIDLLVGATGGALSSKLMNIPANFNSSGETSAVTQNINVTLNQTPAVSFTGCPTSVTAGSGTVTLSASTSNAGSVIIKSATSAATLINSGTVAAPNIVYTLTPEDIANGYATISITAVSSAGSCETSATCQFNITGVAYDYGDAPAVYDANKNVQPTAAASTVINNLFIGKLGPTTESVAKHSANALGDGMEEDGIMLVRAPLNGTTWNIPVEVTNNTSKVAYLALFADLNRDGDFFDQGEKGAIVVIPSNSGTAVYNVAVNVPESYNCGEQMLIRARVSTSLMMAERSYGAAAEGEVEDHLISTALDYGNLPVAGSLKWPVASAGIAVSNKVWLGQNNSFPDVSCNNNTNKNGGLALFSDDISIAGNGSENNPFVFEGIDWKQSSVDMNFNITINGNGPAGTLVYYGVWFDANGNGSFTDADDVFITGNRAHGSPVSFLVPFNFINGGTNSGASSGAIRIVATSENFGFTKAQNGAVNVANGEVEDYYVIYPVTLPVNITGFNLSSENCEVIINWSVESEEMFSHYEIERINEQNQFVKIAEIKGGNHHQYTYKDDEQSYSERIYRLKITDLDGKFYYSNVKSIHTGCIQTKVKLYPNPARNEVNLSGLNRGSRVILYNSAGQVIQEYMAEAERMKVNLMTLANGIYNIVVIEKGGNRQNIRLIRH